MNKEFANRVVQQSGTLETQASKAASLARRKIISEKGPILSQVSGIVERKAGEILREHFMEASERDDQKLWRRAEATNNWYEMITK